MNIHLPLLKYVFSCGDVTAGCHPYCYSVFPAAAIVTVSGSEDFLVALSFMLKEMGWYATATNHALFRGPHCLVLKDMIKKKMNE